MKNKKPRPTFRPLPRTIKSATVIGLGGVGRQVAIQLAAIGIPKLQLMDARIVSLRRYAAEGYALVDVGCPKVHATAQVCHVINPQLDLGATQRRLLRGVDLGDAVFCCPGSPSIRGAVRQRTGGRTLVASYSIVGTTLHLYFARGITALAEHVDARPPAEPIHVATIGAGLLVAEFLRFSGGDQQRRAISFDLQALRLEVEEAA